MTTLVGRYVSGKVIYCRQPLNLMTFSNRLTAIHSIGHGSLNGKIIQTAILIKTCFDSNLTLKYKKGKTAVAKVLKLDVDSIQDPTL